MASRPDPQPRSPGKAAQAALALAQGQSMRETAKALKVDEKTVRRWAKGPKFQARVEELRGELTAQTLNRLATCSAAAVAELARLMTTSANDSVRLGAARAVLDKLKAEMVLAILVTEAEVAFQVLPLNTEKAHNLKEKALEVIRMYRGALAEQPTSTEEDWAFQFESAHLITLGLLYEQNKRFAGGAFAPILRRVDKFLKVALRKGLEEREERAALVRAADEALNAVVARVKRRGINHPYVKNYLLARTTPLTRARKTLPSFEQTFRKLKENLEEFDVSKVRYDEIQRSAIMMAPAAAE